MQTLEFGYTIRSALAEELIMLARIEQSAAIRFLVTPYAFLVEAKPLPLDFVQQRFQAGQVWVAVDKQDSHWVCRYSRGRWHTLPPGNGYRA